MTAIHRTDSDNTAVSLDICPECYSDLVQPTSATASRASRVELCLRCPECHHRSTGVYDWETARSFGRRFAAGRAMLRAAYHELSKENFRDELDCFVLALASDLIGPDDFAPYRFTGTPH